MSSHERVLSPATATALDTGLDTAPDAPLSTPTPFAQASHWCHHARIERRVVGQLLQTLLYEDVLPYEAVAAPAGGSGATTFVLTLGRHRYRVSGWQCHSFRLIRLEHASLVVEARDESESGPHREASSAPGGLQRFLEDLEAALGDVAIQPGFVNELTQTLIKDLQSSAWPAPYHETPQALEADALEQYFTDAHSYHPCYKSRLGFSLRDNQRYGPEFAQPLRVLWLAVPARLAQRGAVGGGALADRLAQAAGPAVLTRLDDYLARRRLARDEAVLMPVHPWQWENALVTALYPELASGEIALLGEGETVYTAQQSIRTLAPQDTRQPYLKLAMSITNTSSTRILARHTVTNGPRITEWLQRLIDSDATAQDAGVVILGEVAGVALDERAFPEARYHDVYGRLGALWRQNVGEFLEDGERAVPFNGLSQFTRDAEGVPASPFIAPWVERHGLEAWTRQLVRVATLPIIHLLFAEGVGMESHGQNIVVIHRDGWPLRVALKDLHDGVRFSPAHLARPELAPDLEPVPERHATLNCNSFLATDDPEAVRDYSCDAFFFIALAEMAIFLHRHFGLDEPRFWAMAADEIKAYQRAHPQHGARYRCFDVFSPRWEVEALTRRRLFGDDDPQVEHVPNPLAAFAPREEAAC